MGGKGDGKHHNTKKSGSARHAAERREKEDVAIRDALTNAARRLVMRPVGRHGNGSH